MALRYASAISLGGIELSDHFRSPVSTDREGRMVEIELASGKIKRYWKGASRSVFTLSWQWLPSLDANTVDDKAGRDTLRTTFKDSQVLHTLIFRDSSGGTETYTVWVDSYSEELTRRDTEYFWTVNLAVREQ